ncbi:MAG: hypothetical protein JJU28_12730 [Cyclobacteriaceae bacterium]|nr:hypothetical protein [Cyclobacteriaceae bacterium]
MKQRRLFPHDKNYILMQAQEDMRKALLRDMVEMVKANYEAFHNPLGLIDDTILQIRQSKRYPVEPFMDFYHDLSVIYRYKFGEVQLEFIWDGRSHYQKYCDDWQVYFKQSVSQLCHTESFVKVVLAISVFMKPGTRNKLVKNRLRNLLTQRFELKINKQKGLILRKA